MTNPYADELRSRFGLDIDFGGEPPDNPWLHQLLMRRTHRRYSDRDVPDALVRLLLAAAFSASSKSDFQQASVLWLKDRARRDRLASLFPDMPWIGASPVFLVFLGDAHRLEHAGFLRLGAGIARKGWLTKADVINTLPLKALRKELARKRAA